MGFAGMAALTHKMEDVFELLRQRTRRPRAQGHRRPARVPRRARERRRGDRHDRRREARPRAARRAAWTASSAPARPAQAAVLQGGDVPPPDLFEARRRTPRRCTSACASTRRRRCRPCAPSWSSTRSRSTASCCIPRRARPRSTRSPAADRRVDRERRAEPAVAASLAQVADVAGLPEVTEVTEPREAEVVQITDARRAPPADARPARPRKRSSTVRVDSERLDALMHAMGELVVYRTHVEALAAGAQVPGPRQPRCRTSRAPRRRCRRWSCRSA